MQLQELKNQYAHSRASKHNYHTLLMEREKLYESMHRAEQKVCALLKKELRALDHALDRLGEDHETRLAQIKEALVAQIHHSFPDSHAPYQTLMEQLSAFQNEERHLSDMIEKLRPFHAALKSGKEAKLSRGVWAFLGGRNEKVLLAQAIQKGMHAAKESHPHVRDEKIHSFLTHFIEEAAQPWNGSLYKSRFYELEETFNQLMKEVEEKMIQSRRSALNIAEQIDVWIESY